MRFSSASLAWAKRHCRGGPTNTKWHQLPLWSLPRDGAKHCRPNPRLYSTSLPGSSTDEKTSPLQPVTVNNPARVEERLDKFIPLTRRGLLRLLMEEQGLLDSEDKRLMGNVAAALDAKYSKRFYSILEQAKSLYDSMDPDRDTHQSRVLSRKEVLDNEYNLLLKVEKLLDKANFIEIPRKELVPLLHDHNTNGLIVSVDPTEYEQLRIWTRGWEVRKKSMYVRLKDYTTSLVKPEATPESSGMLYSRVFLAVRSKKENMLHLKVFKDIPANNLEHLLPKGKIKMSTFDKSTLVSSVLLGACIPFVKILPILSNFKIQWMWGGVGLAALVAGRAWVSYKNKRNRYLASLATTLYFKTVANNRGVLTLLTDRAQDEEFKEALLAYTFLLCPAKNETVDLPVYDTPESLKRRIEAWLKGHIKAQGFSFDILDALEKLKDLGLLVTRRNGTLTALPVSEALSVLPAPSERWLAVAAQRDSQSLDEQLQDYEDRAAVPGWT